MKNRPIAFQIWFIMTGFVIAISIIIVFSVSVTINNYFENKTLVEVKSNQLKEMGKGHLSSLDSKLEKALEIDRSETTNHVLISKRELNSREFVGDIAKAVAKDVNDQKQDYKEYARNYDKVKLFYVVRSFIYNNEQSYLITIYWDKEQNKIIYALIKNIIKVITIAIIINIILTQAVSKGITAPIRYIERKVSLLAKKEWDTEIVLNRRDELGRLATSINTMKDSLKQKDIEEQTFIQTISHDLKTPVMIIRSYARALLDRMYVNNSYEDTVTVIETEAVRLESKIEKLLYLYCFDYIMNNIKEYEKVNMRQLVEHTVNKLSLCRKDIEIKVDVQDISIIGSQVDLVQAFENILENNLRYAKTHIEISSITVDGGKDGRYDPKVEMEVFNDGKPIDGIVIKNLFNKYQKGKEGHFGLGLFIAKKIIEYHRGEIRAENLENGVVFKVVLPINQ